MPTTWVATTYRDVVSRVILAWKDQDRPDLAGVLMSLLARVMRSALEQPSPWTAAVTDCAATGTQGWVVPIPSRASSTRQRGRFPVGDLVRSVCAGQLDPALVPAPLLRVQSSVRDQAGLSAGQRAENIGGSMLVSPRCHRRIANVPVLLVDDVVTTGATLTEASQALRGAGSGPVLAVALAATPRLYLGNTQS